MSDSTLSILDDLLSTLPVEVARAAELFSLPHSLDDPTAVDLVQRFTSANGSSSVAVAEVKRLPFVSPLGVDRWKVADSLREALVHRVERTPDLAREVDAFLADRLAISAQELPDESPAARQLRWRSIYHRLPVSPKDALGELDDFVERAASARQLSDLRAAAELTEQRNRWLAGYKAEVAYIVGRSAYAFKDFDTAEDRFLLVWQADNDDHRRMVSGHLLGAIWSKRGRQSDWIKAEQILEEAAPLARDCRDPYGESVILTTLGTVQSKIGGKDRLESAEKKLRRSLEISAQTGTGSSGLALGTLGAVLFRLGSRTQLLEAEDLLRRGIELLPYEARGAIEDRLARVLGRLGGEERLKEAEALLARRVKEETDPRDVAITLHMLAQTLMRRGDETSLTKADEAAVQSIKLGREIGNPRHTAMALLTGSFIAEKSGNLSLAILRMEETVAINEGLGLAHQVEKSTKRLLALRARLGHPGPASSA